MGTVQLRKGLLNRREKVFGRLVSPAYPPLQITQAPVPIHRNSGSLSGAPHPRSRHVRGIPNPISPDPSTIPLVTSMIPSIVREKTSPPSDATTAWQCFVYGSGSGWSVPCRPLCVDSTDPFASPMHCRYAPFTVTHITSDSDIRILIRITAY